MMLSNLVFAGGNFFPIRPFLQHNRKSLLLVLSIMWFGIGHAQIYNIQTFGAVSDGRSVNSVPIQTAIDTCAARGGGTVLVPAGTFLVGTIHLKSRVTLHLENGAVLKGSPSLNDYKKYKVVGYDSQYYGMLVTEKAHDVAITGLGTIDGADSSFFDWTKAKTISPEEKRFSRQKINYRDVKSGLDDGPVVPNNQRPHQMVLFSQCEKITVSDVTLSHSPFWTLHFADCGSVSVANIRLWSGFLVPNADGIDITSSNNVIVSGCDIRTGDDAIAITGYDHHFEIPGFSGQARPCENIVINHCLLQSYSSAIRIGYLDQNPVRNVFVSDVSITNSTRGIGVFLRDRGSIEHIRFSHIYIETFLRTGDWWGNGEPIHISAVRGKENVQLGRISDLAFDHIDCISENGALLYADAECPLSGIRLEDIHLTLKKSKLNSVAGGNIDLRGCLRDSQKIFAHDIPALLALRVNNLTIRRLQIVWDSAMTEPYFSAALEIQKSQGVNLEEVCGNSAPVATSPPINLISVTGLSMDERTRRLTKGSPEKSR